MTAETNAAALRVQAYLDRLAKSKGIHKEEIHGFDVGEPSEAVLLASDLAALLRAGAAKVPEKRCGYCDGTGDVTDQTGEWRGVCTECDAELRNAAQAVVDRWDTPLWKDEKPTADYIARLRRALATPPAPDAGVVESKGADEAAMPAMIERQAREIALLTKERDNYRARFEANHMDQMNQISGGRHADGRPAW